MRRQKLQELGATVEDCPDDIVGIAPPSVLLGEDFDLDRSPELSVFHPIAKSTVVDHTVTREMRERPPQTMGCTGSIDSRTSDARTDTINRWKPSNARSLTENKSVSPSDKPPGITSRDAAPISAA